MPWIILNALHALGITGNISEVSEVSDVAVFLAVAFREVNKKVKDDNQGSCLCSANRVRELSCTDSSED